MEATPNHPLRSLLPDELNHYLGSADNCDEIYNKLTQDTDKLVMFISSKKDDLFKEEYRDLAKKLFGRVSEKFNLCELSQGNLDAISKIIREDPKKTREYLPLNVSYRDQKSTHNRLHLFAQSSYFSKFFGDWKDGYTILFPECSDKVAEHLLNLLNGENISVKEKQIEELLSKGDCLGLFTRVMKHIPITEDTALSIYKYASNNRSKEIQGKALELIAEGIDKENFFNLYRFANENNFEELKQLCLNFVLENLPENLLTLSHLSLENLLDTLNPSIELNEATAVETQSKTSTRNTDEQAVTFLRQAIPILAKHSLPADYLRSLEPDGLILLLVIIPQSIKSLDLTRYNDEEIARIIPHLPTDLREINISNAALDHERLDEIFSRCKIERLYMKSLQPIHQKEESMDLSDRWLTKLKNLRTLDITGCKCLTADQLSSLISQSPDLEELRAGYNYATDKAKLVPTHLIDLYARIIGQYCNSLKTLDLSHTKLSSVGFQEIERNKKLCESLEVLDLTSCYDLDRTHLLEIPKNFPNLKELRADNIPTISSILQCLPKLEKLNLRLNTLSQEDLMDLLEKCPLMKSLEIDQLNPSSPSIPTFLAQLESIEINCNKGEPNDKLIPILKDFPLKNLSIANCKELTDDFLKALEKKPLRHLKLGGYNANFSDEAMAQLIETLPDLITFDIQYSKDIGNKTLQAIGRCSNLETVGLFECNNVGKGLDTKDEVFKSLAGLKKLKKLFILGTSIPIESIVYIIKSHPYLEELSLPLNFEDTEALVEISRAVPRLKGLSSRENKIPKGSFSRTLILTNIRTFQSQDIVKVIQHLKQLEYLCLPKKLSHVYLSKDLLKTNPRPLTIERVRQRFARQERNLIGF